MADLKLRIAFITLGTDNLARLVEFYHRFLQRAPTMLQPGRYAEFQLPGLQLSLFQPTAIAPTGSKTGSSAGSTGAEALNPDIPHPETPPERSRPLPRGWSLCLEVEDLDGAIAQLIALGHGPTDPIQTASHGREVYAYDPDGNGLILHESWS